MSEITYIRGNIFDSTMQVITNPINCVGTMGAGLAKEFKTRYPGMFSWYIKLFEARDLEIGRICLYKKSTPWVLMFPTKDHWRDPSKYEYIQQGLDTLRDEYKNLGITSIAIPPPGCGLGGLDFHIVKEMIITTLGPTDLVIEIYVQ